MGLNGVDNGAIRFTHVRVPRTALLDRFGSVDKTGKYSNPLGSSSKRFAATLGELTGGRVGLTAGSVGVLKGAVTIAVRYCTQVGQDHRQACHAYLCLHILCRHMLRCHRFV